jgi:hypothetical protein
VRASRGGTLVTSCEILDEVTPDQYILRVSSEYNVTYLMTFLASRLHIVLNSFGFPPVNHHRDYISS